MYRQIPFLRLLLPFVTGIILAIHVNLPFSHFALTLMALGVLATLVVTYIISPNWHYRWVFGLIVSVFLFISGMVITLGVQTHSEISDGEESQVVLRVVEPVEQRTTSYRVMGRISMLLHNNVWQQLDEKVIIYFSSSDSMAPFIMYGDVLALKANFSSPPRPMNPYQFDYREYLAKRQIHRVAFVASDSWIVIDSKPKRFMSKAFRLRDWMFTLFKSVGIEDENLAVLSALTTGYKGLLDNETRRVFSASGAMHILAVSGLHVGILFATLSGFLFFLARIKRGKLIKAAILVGFLWFFAVFTGLSPSVIRASLMFSLVIIGTTFSVKTNIYNTISASAFIILAINPMLIAEVGFQLSYIAVISIVFFYPHIYKLFYIKNRWLDKVWVLISVSLAAQVGTFALGLFYFSQFPNYFLFTNLYAIPLAFVILYLAIALVICSPIPIMASVIGWVLNSTLTILNYLIKFTEALPYSTTSGISISTSQTLLIAAAILMLALFLHYRKPIYIISLLFSSILFFAEGAYSSIHRYRQSEVVIFGQRQATVIGFKHLDSFILVTSDTLASSAISDYNFSIEGYLNTMGLSKNTSLVRYRTYENDLSKSSKLMLNQNSLGSWFVFLGKTVFIPASYISEDYHVDTPFDVDVFLINRESLRSWQKIISLMKPKVVVIDASVPIWQQSRIEEILKTQGIAAHYISQQGAFILR